MQNIKITNTGANQPDACEYCAKTHEADGSLIDLRPYGKNKARICYECGMKPENVKIAKEEFDKLLNTSDVFIIGPRENQNKNN